MVKDAEAHAAEDKKQLEIVTSRNQLDSLLHSVQKSLKEYGDKISADEKASIEAAIKDAEEAMSPRTRRESTPRRRRLAGSAETRREDVRRSAAGARCTERRRCKDIEAGR